MKRSLIGKTWSYSIHNWGIALVINGIAQKHVHSVRDVADRIYCITGDNVYSILRLQE